MEGGYGWWRKWLLATIFVVATFLRSDTVDGYNSCQNINTENFASSSTAAGWTGYGTNASLGWTLVTMAPAGVTAPTGTGLYAYINTAQLLTPSAEPYTLKSPTITKPDVFFGSCYVSFYYSMNGKANRTVELYEQTVSGSTRNVLWSRPGSQCSNGTWAYADVHIPHNSGSASTDAQGSGLPSFSLGFEVVYESVMDSVLVGDIALRGIAVRCCAGCSAGDFIATATFESGSDGFTFDPSGQSSFKRYSGASLSTGTGPAFDHTVGQPGCSNSSTNAGSYFHVEASLPRSPGRASLLSPVYTIPRLNNDTVCFVSFFLSLYGNDIGRTAMQILTANGADNTWCSNGQHTTATNWAGGLAWFRPGPTVQLNFTVELGTSFLSDVAIDDVRMSCCQDVCHHYKILDFECGLDGFQGPANSSWTRVSIFSPTAGNLPNNYVIQSTHSQTSSVTLSLPSPAALGYNCTTDFFIYIDKDAVDAVEVLLNTSGPPSLKQAVWTLPAGKPAYFDVERFSFLIPANSSNEFTLTWVSNKTSAWSIIQMDQIRVVCCPIGQTPTLATTKYVTTTKFQGTMTKLTTMPTASPATNSSGLVPSPAFATGSHTSTSVTTAAPTSDMSGRSPSPQTVNSSTATSRAETSGLVSSPASASGSYTSLSSSTSVTTAAHTSDMNGTSPLPQTESSSTATNRTESSNATTSEADTSPVPLTAISTSSFPLVNGTVPANASATATAAPTPEYSPLPLALGSASAAFVLVAIFILVLIVRRRHRPPRQPSLAIKRTSSVVIENPAYDTAIVASTPPNIGTILYEEAVEITAEATPRYESINTANTSSAPAAASTLPSIATILYEEAVENTAEATPRYESVNTADTSSAPAAESDDKVSPPEANHGQRRDPAAMDNSRYVALPSNPLNTTEAPSMDNDDQYLKSDPSNSSQEYE